MATKRKYKTHRGTDRRLLPSVDMGTILEIAKLFSAQQAERERSRLEVFERAWNAVGGSAAKRAALAVAYLGGSK